MVYLDRTVDQRLKNGCQPQSVLDRSLKLD